MNQINRRKFFLNGTGIFFGSAFLPLSSLKFNSPLYSGQLDETGQQDKQYGELGFDIAGLPNFCSHEHWGSIDSIGFSPEQDGFRADTVAGARPLRATSIWDLILDPYGSGWYESVNRDPAKVAAASGYSSQKEWWDAKPEAALKEFHSLSRSSLLIGGFQCTRMGIKFLHGIDIASFQLQDWRNADGMIKNSYSDIFSWYGKAMQKAHFSELIRPVHPEFYVNEYSAESKKQELSFTHTIMRVDPLLNLWQEKSPRRNALATIAGIEPADAGSWREFIKRIFDLAAKNNTTGIKQLQAYTRDLNFQVRNDAEVVFRGNLDTNAIKVFQDWVMNECCKQAHERNWIHQIHVGTVNLSNSTPLPLEFLSKRYPRMNIVMIHCWPFLKEAGWLAKNFPNIYIDTCWLPVLNPDFLGEGFNEWLNYVPYHKIMLAHDSTSIEMAVGSSLFTRQILAEKLIYQKKRLQLPSTELKRIAADMLHNNAVRLYEVGKELIV